MKKDAPRGIHYLINIWGCDNDQIDSIEFWQQTLAEAAKKAGLEIIDSTYHKFIPQGVTALLLLSSSHLSVHTWPEFNYLACDLFSCSCEHETKKAIDYLLHHIQHDRHEVSAVIRGYVTAHNESKQIT
jgi:S-adenosylmethionine decarboxylase